MEGWAISTSHLLITRYWCLKFNSKSWRKSLVRVVEKLEAIMEIEANYTHYIISSLTMHPQTKYPIWKYPEKLLCHWLYASACSLKEKMISLWFILPRMRENTDISPEKKQPFIKYDWRSPCQTHWINLSLKYSAPATLSLEIAAFTRLEVPAQEKQKQHITTRGENNCAAKRC